MAEAISYKVKGSKVTFKGTLGDGKMVLFESSSMIEYVISHEVVVFS